MLQKSQDTGFVDMPISNSQLHLSNLIKNLPWQQSSFGRRKVCQIGCDYTYSNIVVKGVPFEVYKPLKGLLDRVNSELGTSFNSILVNWYPAGSSVGIGVHKDDEKELVHGSKVCSISLGATMPFILQDRYSNPSESIRVDLKDGDVFLMGTNCQKHYFHSIPKMVLSSDRVSLTFREFV